MYDIIHLGKYVFSSISSSVLHINGTDMVNNNNNNYYNTVTSFTSAFHTTTKGSVNLKTGNQWTS